MSNAPIKVTTTPPLPGAQLANEINAGFLALGTRFSGPDDPAVNAGPYMCWADTGTGRLRQRNGANNAWLDLGPLQQEPAEPVDGALFASQAWVSRQLEAMLPGLPIYASGDIPTSNLGPIFGVGKGIMAWNGSAYVPNNLPAQFRAGGKLTPSAASVGVSAGRWRSSDDVADLILAAALTKNLQTAGAWTAGNNQNGLFSGARTANTWYHVYAIQRDTTGAVDVGFSTSYPPADLPSGWSKWRRLGSVLTTGTNNLLAYLHIGNKFIWNNTRPTADNATITTGQLLNMDVPPHVRVSADLTLTCLNDSGTVLLGLFSPEAGATFTNWFGDFYRTAASNQQSTLSVVTNTARQVQILGSVGATSRIYIGTKGWTDFLED